MHTEPACSHLLRHAGAKSQKVALLLAKVADYRKSCSPGGAAPMGSASPPPPLVELQMLSKLGYALATGCAAHTTPTAPP